MAIWIIAVLSVMVVSFAYEARQQAGVNVYVRERARVKRLIEPGRILGETVMLGYSEAKAWSQNEDPKELDEDDRFYREKRELKYSTRCTIGPMVLDEEDPDAGTVKVDIELSNSGSENGININQLYSGGDQKYALRWQMILLNAGIPEELEVEVKEPDGRFGKKHNLMNHLIACWNDWRDDDDNVSAGPLEGSDYNPQSDDGAEAAYYKEFYEEREKDARGREAREQAKEERRTPRNGAIPDIKELEYVRGFRDFPAVLTGGLLYPEEDESEENPRIKGIVNLFGTTGSSKIVINPDTTVDQLMTIPGIYPQDIDDAADSKLLAQAILDGLKVMPEDEDVDETRTWWPYKDWQDLNRRLDDMPDLGSNVSLGQEASEYIEWEPSETSVFKMTIAAESMGMKHTVTCECYVNSKDKKVRYIKWRED